MTVLTAIPHHQPQEIQRPHLHQKIKFHHPGVVLLLAGSGFGKTTLLAQHARHSRIPTVWLTLSIEHQDIHHFIRSLHLAFEQQGLLESLGWHSHELHQVSTQRLAVRFQQELSDLRRKIRLVIDQLEHLSTEALQWLSQVVKGLPRSHQWILSGQPAPHLDFSGWETPHPMVTLGPEELSFTLQETRGLLPHLPQEDAQRHHTRTAGWPLGVAMLTDNSEHHGDVFSWLMERYHALPLELQHVLPGLATQSVWTSGTCLPDGTPPPAGWQQELLRAGFPLQRQGDQLHPHPLLLEFLEGVLQKDPERHQLLHHLQAKQDEQQGKHLSALWHHQKSGRPQYALPLLGTLIDDLNVRRQYRLVRKVLSSFHLTDLPSAFKAQLYASYLDTGDAQLAFRCTRELIESGFMDHTVCWVMVNKCFREGQFTELLEWNARGRALGTPMSELKYGMSEVMARSRLGHHQEALQAAQDYLKAAQQQGNLFHTARAWVALANAHGDRGDLAESEQCYLTALQQLDRYGEIKPKLEALYNLSITYADQGRNDEALQLLNEGLAVPDTGSWKCLMLGVKGSVHAQMRQWDAGVKDFTEALSLTEQFGWSEYTLNYNLGLSDLHCFAGKPHLAEPHLTRASMISENQPSENIHALQFSLGLYHVTQGNTPQATTHLQQVKNINLVPWNWALTAFLQAECHRQAGTLTRDLIDVAFSRLAALGISGPLLQAWTVLQDLLQYCLERGWYTSEIQQAQPEASGVVCHLQLLGQFQLQGLHRQVVLSSRKSRELLAFLVMHGPSRREVLIDALWDGSRDARHLHNFKFVLRQARQDLQQGMELTFDPLPFERGVYRVHPDLQVQCDVLQYLQPFPSSTAELQSMLQQFPALWDGLQGEWAHDLQQQCEEHHLQGILLLCSKFEPISPLEARRLLHSNLTKFPNEPRLLVALQNIEHHAGK